ncbi:MAG TPA: oligosaccharide flippase family protein [Kofleriaceae bacterium]|nr:oligosaccharide flippase family protein [Kofleriaceae bacterium]
MNEDTGRTRAAMRVRVNRGLAWVGIASSMVGVLDLLAFAILLKFWISQEQVGIASLAVSLFPLLDLITDLGLTAAVIQREDHTADRISTVFWLNLAMSLVLALFIGVGVGPFLSWLQNEPIVTWMLLAYGGKLVWQNVYFIPYALMKRELRFKELSIVRIVANLAEFAGKIGFAAAGFGVWAFVLGPLCRVVVTGVGVQILHPWRPRMVLRLRDALDWTSYGIKTSGSKILFHLYSKADYQVVHYFFGSAATGLYVAASTLVLQPALVISEVVMTVAFPVFSRLKDQRAALIDQLVAFTRMNLVVMLAFIGLVLVSAAEIFGILNFGSGEDWTLAAPAARILCAVAVLRALSFIIPPLLDGINRPLMTLRYMVIASVVLPLMFLISAVTLGRIMGFESVAVAWVVGYPVAFAALLYMALHVLDLGAGEFLRRIGGIPLCALPAVAASYAVHYACGGMSALVRFGASTVVMLAVFSALLARYQGITLRSVVRSLRGS